MSQSSQFNQRVVLVTGGTKGIGRGIAEAFLGAGARVVVCARSAPEQLPVSGEARAEFATCDVRDADAVRELIAQITSRHGRLDVLINNAGVAAGGFPPVGPEHSTGEVPLDTLRRVYETNFFAPVALTQTLLPLIRKSPAGRIVNLSSILGSLALHADPKSPIYQAKSFAYDASKTALNAFTIHLAYELRDTPIKVNSAHPGWVKTDMGGDSAPMELSEGAKTSAALATLPADGPTGGFFHLGQPLPW